MGAAPVAVQLFLLQPLGPMQGTNRCLQMFISAVWILLLASGQVFAALDPEEMQRRLLAGAPILGEC
jgi:hypothetical protein